MTSDAIERLETRLAFLESNLAELGGLVFRQQQEILELRAQLSALMQRLATQQSVQATPTAGEERPPHY
ncbi:MAG: SlyX family protein [Proteobacteria bacterium]|nr:SlyX family protein [Pseudomonadota bacterium]